MPGKCRDCGGSARRPSRPFCGPRVSGQFLCRDCGRLFRQCWSLRAHRGPKRQDALRIVADNHHWARERGLVLCPDDTHLVRVCRLACLAVILAHSYERCKFVDRYYIPEWAEEAYWAMRSRGYVRTAAVELLRCGRQHPVVAECLAIPAE